MFKKKCSKCNEKINRDYDFCPFCGNNLKSPNHKEEYGFLGKNDLIEEEDYSSTFEDSFMDKIFENAMKMAEKMLEKQMKDFPGEMKRINMPEEKPANSPQNMPNPNLEIQFFVNGKRVLPQGQGEQKRAPELRPIKIENKISKEKAERFSKYPRKEPASKVRRFSGKVIYEIEIPGVKKIDDVLINQLEDSIEIKALGKDKVYSKTLNINLPILGYKLEEGNLILELKG